MLFIYLLQRKCGHTILTRRLRRGGRSFDAARRLHQCEQFVNRPLRRLSSAVGVFGACDSDLPNDGFDLVAEVGEKLQRIFGIVSDFRDKARDQNLAGDHPPIQFIHLFVQQRFE
jgi:hypothetical protein